MHRTSIWLIYRDDFTDTWAQHVVTSTCFPYNPIESLTPTESALIESNNTTWKRSTLHWSKSLIRFASKWKGYHCYFQWKSTMLTSHYNVTTSASQNAIVTRQWWTDLSPRTWAKRFQVRVRFSGTQEQIFKVCVGQWRQNDNEVFFSLTLLPRERLQLLDNSLHCLLRIKKKNAPVTRF